MVREAISQSSVLKSSVEKTQADQANGPSTNVTPKARCRVFIIAIATRRAQARASGCRITTGIVASKTIVVFVMKMMSGLGMCIGLYGYGYWAVAQDLRRYPQLVVIGFLGKDATAVTTNNANFTALSLATKSSYKDKTTGKYIDHTEWHRCIVWGKLAEYAKTLKKGAHLAVEGELRSRERTDKKTGQNERIWEVRLTSILKLDRAEKAGPEEADNDEFNPEEEAA